jgi:hypothetical protein
MRFDPQKTIFAGMSIPAAKILLANAQAAYVELMMGRHVTVAGYEGKSASFAPTDPAKLTEFIGLLQAYISGIRDRRPIRPYYR